MVPNSQIWGNAIKNVSFNPTRRIDLLIGISYEDDIGKAVAAIQAVLDADARIRKDPASLIAVSELADSSVNLVVRAWCESGNYWPTRFDLTRNIKERLDAENISIPYPQRQIHMTNA
jgi:small conductance mechanosensitive channel